MGIFSRKSSDMTAAQTSDMTAAQSIEKVLETGEKVGAFCKMGQSFHQLDTIFFLMSYADYVEIAAGRTPKCNAIDPRIAAGGYRGKTLSAERLNGSSASIGTWMYEHYIADATTGGMFNPVSNQVNIGSADKRALTQIYQSPGKPFTPANYTKVYDVLLLTLTRDKRYSLGYKRVLS
ncbi:MAG: hypothetical protein JKY14_11750 [Paraglaciecola sp.]|nr:hypothetical protein [Paraglaciecola sp.]